MKNRNLLIISHNIIDKSNNVGKTVISLLKKWPKENIYSIYFRNEVRGSMYCNNSYMITDRDIIKSLCKFTNAHCGREVEAVNNDNVVVHDLSAYRIGNKRYPIISLMRDLLWHTGIWKSHKLNVWLERIKPSVILFVPNDYLLAFEVAEYIKSITEAKMFTFFTDDPFYYYKKTGYIDSIRRNWLTKKGKNIIDKSDGLISASNQMQKEYKTIFEKDSIVLGNCVEITEINPHFDDSTYKIGFVISYIGNLHSNRWKSLLEIGEQVDKINFEKKLMVFIDVFTTSDLSKSIKNKLRTLNCIRMKGAIPPSEVRKTQEESDALLHIEAFDIKSKLSTKLSMSTKIFEYMSRNVPIFAYGPNDISSMSFLEMGPFAVTCNSSANLKSSLDTFLTSKEVRNKVRNTAFDYAKDNFNEEKISTVFFDYINK